MSKQCNNLAERGKFQLSCLRSQHIWSSRLLADYSHGRNEHGVLTSGHSGKTERAPAGCSEEANVVSQDSESDLITTEE